MRGTPFLSRFYYGWVITGTLAITETVSWGILYYAFSALLAPMRDDLGWSVSTLTGGFSAALIVMGLAAPAVGIWLDRHGPRLLMTAGSIVGTGLIVAWSRVTDVWFYYLIWIGIGLAMSVTLYEPAFTAVTAWFERDRARAILIITIFAGFASTIFLPLTGWFETRYGWRDALLMLAVILGVSTILPHALILRRRPEDLGLQVDGRTDLDQVAASRSRARPAMRLGEAVRDKSFWWITSSFFLETISSIALAVHMIPYLIERGESTAFAATATGLIGAAQVAARIVAKPHRHSGGGADLRRGSGRGDVDAARPDRGVLRPLGLWRDQRHDVVFHHLRARSRPNRRRPALRLVGRLPAGLLDAGRHLRPRRARHARSHPPSSR
jgi:MFS family permease